MPQPSLYPAFMLNPFEEGGGGSPGDPTFIYISEEITIEENIIDAMVVGDEVIIIV